MRRAFTLRQRTICSIKGKKDKHASPTESSVFPIHFGVSLSISLKMTVGKMKLKCKSFYVKMAQSNKRDRKPNLLKSFLVVEDYQLTKLPWISLAAIAYIECSGDKNILFIGRNHSSWLFNAKINKQYWNTGFLKHRMW